METGATRLGDASGSPHGDAVIWTLDARDSVMLEVMSGYFALTDAQVRSEILGALRETTDALAAKGINYGALRNALVPQRDRREIGLLFLADQGGYGSGPGSASASVLALLPSGLSCAVLRGDLLTEHQDWGFAVLERHHIGHKEFEISHTSQIYVVYLNNLSDAMVTSITAGLVGCEAYVGYVDCTYGSPMKDWLSTTVSTAYLKVGRTFVNGHEDDVPNDEDYNLPGWPLEDYGFAVRSLQSMYFDLFLAYKIERRVLPGETDTQFALAAISKVPRALAKLDVLVEEEKLGYLREKKLGTLTATGLHEATREVLQAEIRARIDRSYVYEMEYKSAYGTSQFNVMLEMARPHDPSPKRVKAVLSYEPEAERLRLISLY